MKLILLLIPCILQIRIYYIIKIESKNIAYLHMLQTVFNCALHKNQNTLT